MRYDRIYQKDFVEKNLLEQFEYHKRILIDEIISRIWDEWVPGTTLVFEHKFEYLSRTFRDSTLSEIVKEFANNGWTLTFERFDPLFHGFRFKISVS
jgi:hypothetical protein